MKATIYNASAGAGKTYRLAYKYVKEVIKTPLSYRSILAVTFTNKATEEMKSRILKQIHTLASEDKSDYLEQLQIDLKLSSEEIRRKANQAQSLILHDYSRFTILTIDTFFQRVLRAFIQEMGIDIGYSLEIESASIVERSVDELIEQITQNPLLHRWLTDSINERIAEGKGWDIRKSIMELSGEIFNEKARAALENKGSKEQIEAAVKRLDGEVKQLCDQIKAIAHQAQGLMESYSLGYNDFKYASASAVHIFRRYLEGEKSIPSKRVRDAASPEGGVEILAKAGSAAHAIAGQIQGMLSEVIPIIDQMLALNTTLVLYRENMRSYALLSDLYSIVERLCSEQNTMLLNQTGPLLNTFINEEDAPFIYEKVGVRYNRFMIDEFQDTSRQEWRNFLPLLRNAMAESDSDDEPILIVGDVKQSIYRWRGGDWRLLGLEARKELGESQSEVVDMVDNYRSLPRVVEFNNRLIGRVVSHVESDLKAELQRAKEDGYIGQQLCDELSTTLQNAYTKHSQNSPKEDRESGFVEVVRFEEQPPLINRICQSIDRGYRPNEILILTRQHTDAAAAAKLLLEFKERNEDPRYNFDVMTQEALVVGKAPVSRFIIAVMRLSIDPTLMIQRAIFNQFLGNEYPERELDDSTLTFLQRIRLLSVMEIFESIVMQYGLVGESRNVAYVQALHDQVIHFSNNRIGDLRLFVEWWEEKGATKSLSVERSHNAIEILTIHKAKGLEKRVVIIPYCNWEMNRRANGFVRPIVWAKEGAKEVAKESSKEETKESYFNSSFPVTYKKEMGSSLFSEAYYREMTYSHLDSINLLYVALTRAAESLHIFVPIGKEGGVKGVGEPLLAEAMAMATQEQQGESEEVIYSSGDRERRVNREGERDKEESLYVVNEYQSSTPELRLRISTQPQSLRDEGVIHPREMGILLHKAFEGAESIEQIESGLQRMVTNGHINDVEREHLWGCITRSTADPRVAEWFSPIWDSIRSESEILLPGGGVLRPDRVMIKGESCTVVDYKFGSHAESRYKKQLEQYRSQLQKMGYSKVKAYIWYVTEGYVVEIEN